jgi:hypothetical protein
MLFKQDNIKNTNKHNFIMSPVLKGRQKINLASRKLLKAQKKDKTQLEFRKGSANVQTAVIGEVDWEGMKKVYNARNKLKKAVNKRKRGLSGLARRVGAGKEKISRVKNINNLKKRREIINKKIGLATTLVRYHPKLKGIRSGDLIEVVSLSGSVKRGIAVDANSNLLYLQINNSVELTPLTIERLKRIRRL